MRLNLRVELLFLWISIIGVLVCMTVIDWIVHAMLYRYGLRFSYDWANPYWTTLNTSFFMFGLLAASSYWVSRDPKLRHVITAALIFWSVFEQIVSYNLDILWNIINMTIGYRGFPSMSYIWGWGWVDWITRSFLGHPATTRDVLLGSLFMNIFTLALWAVWSIAVSREGD